MTRGRWTCFWVAVVGAWAAAPAAWAVDYTHDVRPIFEKACYSCHGAEKQKAGLRLDVKSLAMKGGESGAVIVPGRASESLLIKLVRGEDAERLMPSKGEKLTAAQVEVLRAWIDGGAVWPDDGVAVADKRALWSLKAIVRPDPPAVADEGAVKNDVDRFVMARLAREGLSMRAEADRRTLIRRVTFDLTGLPPAPGEIEAFLSDTSAGAYERVVDRLLASPRFGERWGRHWLDVVRYADSHGFEMNQPRPAAWPYRDWVIGALNADLPYDEFVRAQIAGDAGEGKRDGEMGRGGDGGKEGSAAAAVAGSPGSISSDAATGFLVAGPFDQVKSPDPALTAQQRADELHDMVAVTGSAFLGLTVGCARCHDHKFDPVSQVDYYRMTAVFAGVKHAERAAAAGPAAAREMAEKRGAIAAVEGKLSRFVAVEDSTKLRPAVTFAKNEERFAATAARFVRFTVLATNNGSEPCLDEVEVYSAGESPRNVGAGAALSSSGDYAGNPKHRLAHLVDGRYGNDWSWISNAAGKGWVRIELAGVETIDRVVWGRDREGKFRDRLATKYLVEVAGRADGPWRVVASSDDRKAFDGKAGAGPRYAAVTPADRAELARLLDEKRSLEAEVARLAGAGKVYAGQFEQPGPTYRLHRGEALAKRETVAPGGLAVLSPALDLPADAAEQRRRVELARWITDPANPLAPRVIVNRLWQHHFGRGIVATPSDFGHMGARPMHPELLDYLAAELLKNGWRMKSIHRLIVTSAAYRQGSESEAKGLAADGDGAMLWRYPPRRLEAEAVRDSMLAVAGNLDLTMGGPGFDFFKPNSNYVRVFEAKEEFGPAEFRRMIYAVKPRMQVDGVFGAFDCPDAGQTQPRRSVSTTPLQALNLLNSAFVLQQSEAMARRLERDRGDVAGRVRLGFELAFGREPTGAESAAAVRLVEEHGLPAFCRAVFNANEFLYVH